MYFGLLVSSLLEDEEDDVGWTAEDAAWLSFAEVLGLRASFNMVLRRRATATPVADCLAVELDGEPLRTCLSGGVAEPLEEPPPPPPALFGVFTGLMCLLAIGTPFFAVDCLDADPLDEPPPPAAGATPLDEDGPPDEALKEAAPLEEDVTVADVPPDEAPKEMLTDPAIADALAACGIWMEILMDPDEAGLAAGDAGGERGIVAAACAFWIAISCFALSTSAFSRKGSGSLTSPISIKYSLIFLFLSSLNLTTSIGNA